MITKRYEQQIEVEENGCIGVRDATIVVIDGVDSPPKFHRKVLEPGSDVTNESVRINAVAPAVWTSAVVAARAAFLADPEAVDPVLPGYVQKNKIRNVILANGAVVQSVLDIVEEDGVVVSEVQRPNRLIDVDADVGNESDQVKSMALAWTQDVKDAATARREAILSKIAEDTAREESANLTVQAATATTQAAVAAQTATAAIYAKTEALTAVENATTDEELAEALKAKETTTTVASTAIAESNASNDLATIAEGKKAVAKAAVEDATAKTAAAEVTAKTKTDVASNSAAHRS